MKNLTGQIIHGIKVLSLKEIKNHQSIWNCQCELCGKQKEYNASQLRNRVTKGCGCIFVRKSPFGKSGLKKNAKII